MALLTFRAGSFLAADSCPDDFRVFSRILGLNPQMPGAAAICDNQNVPRRYPVSPGRQNQPRLRTPGLREDVFPTLSAGTGFSPAILWFPVWGRLYCPRSCNGTSFLRSTSQGPEETRSQLYQTVKEHEDTQDEIRCNLF